jgi:hypothetical protein
VNEPWPTLIQVAAAVILFIAGYFLGRRQGRDQFRYQEDAKVAVEVGKRMAEIRRTLHLAGHAKEVDALTVFERLVKQKNDLRDYADRSSNWLDRRIFQQVLLINDQLEASLSAWVDHRRQHRGSAIDTEAVREFDEAIARPWRAGPRSSALVGRAGPQGHSGGRSAAR